MKKYMVLLFVDSDFVYTDFFNDYKRFERGRFDVLCCTSRNLSLAQ